MSFDLWSRQEGHLRPPARAVFATDGSKDFPASFRTRVLRWSIDSFGSQQDWTPLGDVVNDVRLSMELLHKNLVSAYGRDPLVALPTANRPADWRHPERQVPIHLHVCPDYEVLDYVDGAFQVAAYVCSQSYGAPLPRVVADMSEEINAILQQEGVGYRRVEGRLVRVDDEIIESEAVEPALRALSTGCFGGAAREFDDALAAYRRGAWRDTLTHANAAFESVMKIVTGRAHGQAGELIGELRKQKLLPGYVGGGVDGLVKLLHALPAARGQQSSAHGRGDGIDKADQHLARLALTMSAAFICFLAETAPAVADE
jgi:hypothetical protein